MFCLTKELFFVIISAYGVGFCYLGELTMHYSDESIEKICRKFQIEGNYILSEQIACGHINTTYRVSFEKDGETKDFILQKINLRVFKNPREMMRNVIAVLEHIRPKLTEAEIKGNRSLLQYKKTVAGNYYFYTAKNDFWRCCQYVENSVTYLRAERPAIAEEAGKAYGKFEKLLADFPVEALHVHIPDFHNTLKYFELLKEAIANDKLGRVASAKEEVIGYLTLEKTAIKALEMHREGMIPLRVTHNDTKCSNVLFDRETDKALAVIDLDTVMPGLVAFDFGDAIRVGASTAQEDEQDLSKVHLDVGLFEGFTKGFLGEIKENITEAELRSLPLGAIAMALECGARFLTDYLDGDTYFRTEYPSHNLARCRAQLKLAREMIEKLPEMEAIVEKHGCITAQPA